MHRGVLSIFLPSAAITPIVAPKGEYNLCFSLGRRWRPFDHDDKENDEKKKQNKSKTINTQMWWRSLLESRKPHKTAAVVASR